MARTYRLSAWKKSVEAERLAGGSVPY